MHAKSDSEVTSLAPSSPPRSPRRPVYFVQSPSRDSHDGDSKLSFQSTPILSPSGSPLHHSYSRSRDSSQTLSSGGRGKHGSRRVLPQPSPEGLLGKSSKGWTKFSAIEEEPEVRERSRAAQIYMFVLIFLACAIFIGVFILLYWLICRPQHPEVSVKNVVFHNFYMGVGTDATGVPTKVVSLNCTVQLILHNPSKYLGVHIRPVAVTMYLSELALATSLGDGHFQSKKSSTTVSVVVQASKVPVYGAGNGLSSDNGSKQGIPLQMSTTVRSQFYVVGKMVKPKFVSQATCDLVLDSASLALLTPLRNSCIYSPAH